jgi:hypothetical protein
MGYYKRRKFKAPPFVKLERALLDCKEWRELTRSEMVAYIYLKKAYNGGNNGGLEIIYEKVEDIFAAGTLSAALKGLVEKGWIEKTRYGGMYRYKCFYKLTEKYDKLREQRKR